MFRCLFEWKKCALKPPAFWKDLNRSTPHYTACFCRQHTTVVVANELSIFMLIRNSFKYNLTFLRHVMSKVFSCNSFTYLVHLMNIRLRLQFTSTCCNLNEKSSISLRFLVFID